MRACWLVVMIAGCIRPAAHDCDDGRVCGASAICDTVHHLCVSQDQLDQCQGLDDRTPCNSDVTAGLCDREVCVPACGDGEKQVGEQCDDGNFINHDGCASACSLETGAWSRIPDPWSARWGHTLVYDEQRSVLVMFGGETSGEMISHPTISGDTWERLNGTWTQIPGAGPPARRAAAMVYDSDRHVTVLFGGVDEARQILGDTWEYDGTWRQVMTPGAAPAARYFPAMAYNSTTHRTVLYGGVDKDDVRFGDVWQYDGAAWSLVATSGTSPPSPVAPSIAFDSSRDHMVVITNVGTWELADNGTWSQPGGAQPPRRYMASMTYVPGRQVVLLTGGRDVLTGAPMNDTWEYTTGWSYVSTPTAPEAFRSGATASFGSTVVLVGGLTSSGAATREVWQYYMGPSGLTWARVEPGLIPTERVDSPIVYDPVHREILTYGDERTTNTDTFDGVLWHHRAPGPPTRVGHAMTFDPVHARVVMVGGSVAGAATDETWVWDGSAWSQLAPTGVAPPPRIQAALAADPGTGRVVLFGGGSTFSSADREDTWELDGSTWTQVTPQQHPAAGPGNAMAYDPDLGHIVLFDTSGATWTYGNREWTPVEAPPLRPPGRAAPVFVYDPNRHRLVLYGGSAASTLLDDMWDFDGTTWTPITYDIAPIPVIAPGGAYFEPNRSIVLFGGGAPSATQQMWQFRYRSQAPDEICAGGMDDDGDTLVDGDDPDCAMN